MRRTLVLLALTAVVACRSKEDRGVELAEGYANALGDNAEDCDKAATASLAYAKAHEADFKALAAAKKSDGINAKDFDEKYRDRMSHAMEKTVLVSNKCASNAAFTKSLHDASMLISPK